MCVNMRLDMPGVWEFILERDRRLCPWPLISRRITQPTLRIDVCVDMCVDMCVEMCVDMCIDM